MLTTIRVTWLREVALAAWVLRCSTLSFHGLDVFGETSARAKW